MNIVPLNSEQHKDLKLGDVITGHAATRHMFPLRVTEVANAIVSFPVMVSRVEGTGDMSLSALCSFTPGRNAFVEDDKWTSNFKPVALQTAPFFILPPLDGETEPRLGIDENSAMLSKDKGEPLFTNKGKIALPYQQIKARLIDDANDRMMTSVFLKEIDKLGLLRAVDIVLTYDNGVQNRIRGLNMIQEDRLQSLDKDILANLRDRGFLPAIYAILFSVYQFNTLIQRHNQTSQQQISKINLEVSKNDPQI